MFPIPAKSGRWQIDRTQSIYSRNARSLRLFKRFATANPSFGGSADGGQTSEVSEHDVLGSRRVDGPTAEGPSRTGVAVSGRERMNQKRQKALLRVGCRVPTYIYETTDPTKPVRTFEVKQSVHDEPLRSDPETGEAARRVISAGYNLLVRGKSVGPCVGSVGSH